MDSPFFGFTSTMFQPPATHRAHHMYFTCSSNGLWLVRCPLSLLTKQDSHTMSKFPPNYSTNQFPQSTIRSSVYVLADCLNCSPSCPGYTHHVTPSTSHYKVTNSSYNANKKHKICTYQRTGRA